MAKRRRIIISASGIEKRIKEGRGQGRGPNYLPWLFIHDVPSKGLAWRIKGWKTGRPHHLLSDFEHNYQLIKDWDPSVIDIREQYPLLPLEETLAIAEECNIRHPSVRHPTKRGVVIPEVIIQEAAAIMTAEVQHSTCSLSQIALECDERLHLQPGTCLTIAYHLLATRQWKIDMQIPIQPGNRLILLNEQY
jgi:hypothetical protein